MNGRKFSAIIADTPLKRMIGLMYRKGIKETQCMLFIFDQPGKHAIWMHNMLFAIDVLWIDDKFRVAEIKENFLPCKSLFNCKEYAPKKAAKYVIELNHGAAKRNGIKPGSKIAI